VVNRNMDIQSKIKNWIKEALKIENDLPTQAGFVVEHPSDLKNGDYFTNVAMITYRNTAKFLDSHVPDGKYVETGLRWVGKANNPAELAKIFAQKLNENKISEIGKIEAVGGFINFYLSREFFEESIKKVNELGENVGDNDLYKNKKIIIEHTQPNPFKEFHIGHLMNNAIGESVARITKTSGAEVKTCSYHGDVGLHVAKAIWGLKYLLNEAGLDPTMDILGHSEPRALLKKAYSFGSKKFDESDNVKNETQVINKKIHSKEDSIINKFYEAGRYASLEYFEVIYKRLGSYFDKPFFESETGEVGKKIVLENLGKVFENSDGAVVFRGENFEPKTHTRVFINSQDISTYEAKEIGLAQLKMDAYRPFDKSITITANEQDSFFDVVEVAIGEVFPELKGKLKHLSHGMLKLPSGKMSSRTGDVITADYLINQVKERVSEKIKDREFSEEEKENIAEVVAIGAIKYSILRQAIGGDIIFDFDKSISFEGDSGPYIQYTAVRAKSVLEKSKLQAPPAYRRGRNDKQFPISNLKTQGDWETKEIERLIYRFEEVVERAGKEYAPHYIVTYLTELAGSFNAFYAKEKIMDENDANSPYKLAITNAVFHILKKGLYLLAIKVPERM
jgi:arginyl-tRNA synthetase